MIKLNLIIFCILLCFSCSNKIKSTNHLNKNFYAVINGIIFKKSEMIDIFKMYNYTQEYSCFLSIKIMNNLKINDYNFNNHSYIQIDKMLLKLKSEINIIHDLKRIKSNRGYLEIINYEWVKDYLYNGKSEYLLLIDIYDLLKSCLQFNPVEYCKHNKRTIFEICEPNKIPIYNQIKIKLDDYKNLFILNFFVFNNDINFFISAYDGRIIF